ncbi:hypothetical protein, partial [Pseudomonas sp. 51_B]|uniref:hypothetical protein n=1 Tax=Pseudomonas sp. 51_B TaxID=2813573 RepID=UPI001A9E7E80
KQHEPEMIVAAHETGRDDFPGRVKNTIGCGVPCRHGRSVSHIRNAVAVHEHGSVGYNRTRIVSTYDDTARD